MIQLPPAFHLDDRTCQWVSLGFGVVMAMWYRMCLLPGGVLEQISIVALCLMIRPFGADENAAAAGSRVDAAKEEIADKAEKGAAGSGIRERKKGTKIVKEGSTKKNKNKTMTKIQDPFRPL